MHWLERALEQPQAAEAAMRVVVGSDGALLDGIVSEHEGTRLRERGEGTASICCYPLSAPATMPEMIYRCVTA